MTLKSAILSLLALGSLCQLSMAQPQFNKTWFNGKGIDVVDVGNNTVTVLGTDGAADILLTNLDFYGNVSAFQVGINHSYGNPNEEFRPTKLILTPQGDYIVVGIYSYYDADVRTYHFYPFATRISASGIVTWVQIYRASYTWSKIPVPGYTRANIVLVEDDPNGDESYIISAPGDPHHHQFSGAYPQDIIINAIRIDANGVPLWNKKYVPDASIRTGFYSFESYPQALTYYEDGGGNGAYFIGGTDQRWYMGAGASAHSFYMAIDRNGNMTVPYNRIDVISTGAPVYAWNCDALYDAAQQRVVMAASTINWSGTGSSASAITVVQFDNALNIIQGDYYHHNTDLTENYSFDIEFDVNKGHFLIAAWVFDEFNMLGSMALLKLNRLSMSPVFYKRYNHQTSNSDNAAVIPLVDASNTYENYVMVGTRAPATPNGLRVISTTQTGFACGEDELNPQHGAVGLMGNPDLYVDITPVGYITPTSSNPILFIQSTDCWVDPNYKKSPTSIGESPAAADFTAYPSQFTGAQQDIRISFASESGQGATAKLYNSKGQLLEQQRIQLTEGENELLLQMNFPHTGIYNLVISADDQSMQHTVRLVRH